MDVSDSVGKNWYFGILSGLLIAGTPKVQIRMEFS